MAKRGLALFRVDRVPFWLETGENNNKKKAGENSGAQWHLTRKTGEEEPAPFLVVDMLSS